MKKTKDLNPMDSLSFKIKGVTYLQSGIYRDVNGKFDIVRIKNCDTGTYKNIRYDKLQTVLKNNYVC